MTETTNEPQGLGGWLILPALGLIIMPIRMLLLLHSDFLPIFTEGHWEVLTTPGSEVYHHLWAPYLIFELVSNLAFIAFDLVLVYLFFTRSYRFPRLMIIYLLSNAIFVVGDFFLGDLIPFIAEQPTDMETIKEVVRTVIGTCIWVPYFLVSKRVKNTFVKKDVETVPQAA